jgi:hypothetical protein
MPSPAHVHTMMTPNTTPLAMDAARMRCPSASPMVIPARRAYIGMNQHRTWRVWEGFRWVSGSESRRTAWAAWAAPQRPHVARWWVQSGAARRALQQGAAPKAPLSPGRPCKGAEGACGGTHPEHGAYEAQREEEPGHTAQRQPPSGLRLLLCALLRERRRLRARLQRSLGCAHSEVFLVRPL